MVKLSSKTLALVMTAIKNMRESKGSSSKDILNYISSIYDIPQHVAKRQMVAALKRGVAHGILRKTDGYYSLPTDTETECVEVAAQELGLLDLCSRKKKREQRRSKGCKKPSSEKKKGKSRSKGRKISGRSARGKKSSGRKGKKGGKNGSKKGCECKCKSRGGGGGGAKRSKRSKSKSKKRSKAIKRYAPANTKCKSDYLGIETYANEPTIFSERRGSRCRGKSRSRSCSRNRNIVSTA